VTLAKPILFTTVAFLLAACASTANYEKILSSWVGSDENSLVQNWGPPTRVYNMENGKILTYIHSAGSQATYDPLLRTSFAHENYCKTDFTLDGLSTVKSWRWEGNVCNARPSDVEVHSRQPAGR